MKRVDPVQGSYTILQILIKKKYASLGAFRNKQKKS